MELRSCHKRLQPRGTRKHRRCRFVLLFCCRLIRKSLYKGIGELAHGSGVVSEPRFKFIGHDGFMGLRKARLLELWASVSRGGIVIDHRMLLADIRP